MAAYALKKKLLTLPDADIISLLLRLTDRCAQVIWKENSSGRNLLTAQSTTNQVPSLHPDARKTGLGGGGGGYPNRSAAGGL